ncbi:diguanylate cyclase [Alkalicoccus luteus]|uniref:Diguanylate cyclase n=1 Tax=Alkalicoccus luteus TaxID=1237094 RepID=A0A969PMU9_9BACI|nr:diguanylate cyclase [Alkalicoccus luteus]NJP36193.1 diguanylate cyclase [Alkalicoccus luteus]
MKIRTWALLVVSGLLAGAVLIMQVIIAPMLLTEANEADRNAVEENVLRTTNFLEKEKDGLLRQTIDWAEWDDSHQFITGDFDNYEELNLDDDMLANIRVQQIVFLDQDGELFFEKGIDGEGDRLDQPETFFRELEEHAVAGDTSFFEESNHGLMMMTSHPITRNDGSDPQGTLLMGRLVDEQYTAMLADTLSVDVALLSDERLMSLQEANKINSTYAITEGTVLSVAGERFYYDSQSANLIHLQLTAGAALLVIAGLFFAAFRYFIGMPVTRLAEQVKQIDPAVGGEVNTYGRNAETIQLEREINTMLANIREANQEISKMAYRDQLTGLGNRFYLTSQFDAFLTKHDGRAALLFFDLDGFKKVNDTWGHDTGDKLLQQAARRLEEHFDVSRFITARVGGDEFAVLMAYDSEEDIRKAGAEVIEMIERVYSFGTYLASVSASVGISMYPNDAGSLSELLKTADAAMYEVKQSGKGRTMLYQELKAQSEKRKPMDRNA